MKYHLPTGQFTVDHENFRMAGYSLIYAIRHIRDLAGLPYTKYEREGLLSDADHAQKGILDAARALGVDLGAEWGNELDVSEAP